MLIDFKFHCWLFMCLCVRSQAIYFASLHQSKVTYILPVTKIDYKELYFIEASKLLLYTFHWSLPFHPLTANLGYSFFLVSDNAFPIPFRLVNLFVTLSQIFQKFEEEKHWLPPSLLISLSKSPIWKYLLLPGSQSSHFCPHFIYFAWKFLPNLDVEVWLTCNHQKTTWSTKKGEKHLLWLY